jgi:hypothetical protein
MLAGAGIRAFEAPGRCLNLEVTNCDLKMKIVDVAGKGETAEIAIHERSLEMAAKKSGKNDLVISMEHITQGIVPIRGHKVMLRSRVKIS